MLFKYDLGDRLQCRITGFQGVVTARVENVNGCLQYGLKPPIDKDGKVADARFIDEAQLVLIDAGAVAPVQSEPTASAPRTGGPQADTPRA